MSKEQNAQNFDEVEPATGLAQAVEELRQTVVEVA